MAQNWYKRQQKEEDNKRKPIYFPKKDFKWVESQNLDNCYNVVTLKLDDNIYNFYFWSSSTINTAHNHYKNNKLKKCLSMLKKYSFDVNIIENKDE